MKVVYSKLMAIRNDIGGYIVYVFELLESESLFDKYVMCTRFPNWDSPMLSLGDVGFLKYKEVFAGEDKWFDSNTGQMIPYKYTGIHFIDFVYEKQKTDDLIL